ncbi:MAG: DnaD domain protein [Dehalococcoidia bacterium]|nr:DnaD domain protein [Dehalococcoidia bacterium]MDD5493255.1 DnaD domain protein [Dehalococcoidia bacterium]
MSRNIFKGFPPRAEVTPLPNIFYSEVLPLMENPAEIKVVMQILFLLSRRRGYPKFVTFRELSNDPVVIKGLQSQSTAVDELLKQSLDSAIQHGILVHVPISNNNIPDEAYFINNQNDKETIARILSGALKIPEVKIREVEALATMEPLDIYNLYEQNIGMLTPILAEELQEAEQRYPADWIQEAFKEAIRANVRNWRYINGILKRWEREGKKDGRYVGDSKKERDPDKYIRGKYGHMVRR